MARKYEQKITLPDPPEQVSERVRQVLASVPKARSIAWNPPYITASTGMGWKSYGEILKVQVAPAPNGSEVTIRSEASYPLQLIDFGKHRNNVETIVQGLTGGAAAS